MALLVIGIFLIVSGLSFFASGGFILAAIGGGMAYKGYGRVSGEREKREAEIRRVEDQRKEEERERQEKSNAENKAREDEILREERAEKERNETIDMFGQQNLRRLVNELVDYSTSLEPEQDNKSTLAAMQDTVSRIASDQTIKPEHKADSGIQHDVASVIAQLSETGRGALPLIERIKHYLSAPS